MTAPRQRSITTSSYVLGGPGGGIRGHEPGATAGAPLSITPAVHLSPSLKGAEVGAAVYISELAPPEVLHHPPDRACRHTATAGAPLPGNDPHTSGSTS